MQRIQKREEGAVRQNESEMIRFCVSGSQDCRLGNKKHLLAYLW